jgi:prevent-host-death family protein
MKWPVHIAKARFGELIERALKEGPQTITRGGKSIAVVVASKKNGQRRFRGMNLKELLAAAPLAGVTIRRSQDCGRTIGWR